MDLQSSLRNRRRKSACPPAHVHSPALLWYTSQTCTRSPAKPAHTHPAKPAHAHQPNLPKLTSPSLPWNTSQNRGAMARLTSDHSLLPPILPVLTSPLTSVHLSTLFGSLSLAHTRVTVMVNTGCRFYRLENHLWACL